MRLTLRSSLFTLALAMSSIVSSIVLSIAPSSVAAQSPTLPSLSTATDLGQQLFEQSGSTGLVLVVVRDNQVYFHGYGETAPGSHQPPTSDSVLRLCSLTKIFTTDLLTKLVADNTVHLNDPLQLYAPMHTIVPKRIQPITLFDLATHTSGLPRELGAAPRATPHFTFPDYRTRWRWLGNQRLKFTPGTAALYSNVAFDLLADALQSASGTPYSTLLAQRTLNPLHMRNTTYYPTAQQCSLLLVGGNNEGLCTVTEQTDGSSGLYSNATDMAIWLQYLLRTSGTAVPTQDPAAQDIYLSPGKLISQQGLDHAGPPTGIGLGWMHIQPVDDRSHIIQKTGGGAGFATYIAINHARHTAIFIAATDGPSIPRSTVADSSTTPVPHLNLFQSANNLLLNISGLPPLPPPPPKPIRRSRPKTKPTMNRPTSKRPISRRLARRTH